MVEELSLHVVGARFDNAKGKGNRQFEIMASQPGEPVELRLEPKNKADPNAIAVYSSRGIQIGYLTAERAPLIGSYIRAGRDPIAIFQQATQFGAAIRVGFDGRVPTLPPEQRPLASDVHGESDDSGFYPDFIPPDD